MLSESQQLDGKKITRGRFLAVSRPVTKAENIIILLHHPFFFLFIAKLITVVFLFILQWPPVCSDDLSGAQIS